MSVDLPRVPHAPGSTDLRRSRTARSATLSAAVLVLATAGITQLAPSVASAGTKGHGPRAAASSSTGNLYATTNGLLGNAVRTFSRDNNGSLTLVGDTPTGGSGSGSFEQSANALVLGGTTGESAPNNLTTQEEFLFAVNTGSDSVSVLRAGDQPVLVETEPTGLHPLSVTVNRGLVYVLNGGTTNGMGGLPTITGYTLAGDGQLTPIPGSTQPVSGGPLSGSTQVSFNPAGTVLVVTEKTANVLTSYPVNSAGVAGAPISNANAPGAIGPFGFTFTKDGKLLTSENGAGAPGLGGAASFAVGPDARLTPITPGSISNGQSDTCWIVLTDDQRFAYATNAQSNNISSYTVDAAGRLTLLQGDAARTDELPAVGPTILPADLTLSRDSRYLYERNVMDGDINSYAIGADGRLTLLQRLEHALPAGAIGVAGS